MIQAKELHKSYGPNHAVHGVSFVVQPGEILGFLGPNGAGKSTTLKILSGFLPPSSGNCSIAGFDLLQDSLNARLKTGYLPEHFAAPAELRVGEYLRYRAKLKGLCSSEAKARVIELATRLGFDDRLAQPFSHLSKGFRQRVGLADTLLADPPALLLDEPFTGLDPLQRFEFRELLLNLAQEGKAILFSSHVLAEVEPVADKVLILHHGKMLAYGTQDEILSSLQAGQAIVLDFGDFAQEALLEWDAHSPFPGCSLDPIDDTQLLLSYPDSLEISQVAHWFLSQGLPLNSWAPRKANLDHVFRELIQKEALS